MIFNVLRFSTGSTQLYLIKNIFLNSFGRKLETSYTITNRKSLKIV